MADRAEHECLPGRLHEGLGRAARCAVDKPFARDRETPRGLPDSRRNYSKSFYVHGSPSPELIGPDNWNYDFGLMTRPHSVRINLDLFYDYRTNVDLYPKWQAFLRQRQPKTLIFWGQDDIFFTREGGEAYLRDLPKAEIHRLAAGHFAVEDNLDMDCASTKMMCHANKPGRSCAARGRPNFQSNSW